MREYKTMLAVIKHIKSRVFGNELHANSFYLLLAQGTITLFGYLFWIIIARSYNAHEIGIASAIISIATLIANISILGLNNTLVRFLAKSDRKNELINASLLTVGFASLLCAVIYISAINFFSPELVFIGQNPWLLIMFVVSMALITFNTLTDSVFIAFRSTKYSVYVYLGYSVIRLIMPFALVAFGAIGVFLSHMAGIILAVFLSFYFMVTKLGYRLFAKPKLHDFTQAKSYSLVNYVSGFAWSMPIMIAPILIINELAAAQAAYFYMVMMIINVLLIIPTTFTQSLFAEGSHGTTGSLSALVMRSVKSAGIMIILGVISIVLFGALVLGVFGASYVKNGLPLLYLMAISVPVVHLNMTANVILKIQHRLRSLAIINIAGSILTVVAMAALLHVGLIGIGLGYLLGQLAMGLMNLGVFISSRHRRKSSLPVVVAELA